MLRLAEAQTPKPAAGEVRVRVLASPVNPSDLLTIRGNYTNRPELPMVPGYEGVGRVEAAGAGLIGRMLAGRRVAFLNRSGGAWQTHALIPARQAVPVSDQLPVEQAAMYFVNPATAYLLTREVLAVPSGQWLLHTAAASAVGKMVIRLGRRFGFKTISVVRRAEQAAELTELGANAAIATETEPLADRVRALTGGAGVGFALDCVGGELGSQVVGCLAPGGKLVVYGTLSDEPLRFSSRELMTVGASIEGFWLGNWMARLSLLGKFRLVRSIGRLLREEVLTSPVEGVYPLEQVAEAVGQAERPGRTGKIILRPNEE